MLVMNKEEKLNEIKTLTKDLCEASNFYLTDIAGLDSQSTLDLRRACFESNIRISVVKNTLLKKAMEDSGKEFGDLKNILKGNTSVMFSNQGNTPAKVIKKFRKSLDKPVLKGAFIDESIYIGDDKIDVLADLKSKKELNPTRYPAKLSFSLAVKSIFFPHFSSQEPNGCDKTV